MAKPSKKPTNRTRTTNSSEGSDDNLSFFQKLEAAHNARNLTHFTSRSYAWYIDKMRGMGGARARSLIEEEASENGWNKGSWELGSMYMFGYHAKGHGTKKLPYYDRFPLVVIIDRAPKGFLSLSLHYLPPRLRAVLFDELMALTNNRKYNDRTKFVMTYKLLKSVAENAYYKPCIKHHLIKQLRTKMIKIPASQWEAALFLPTENFYGAVKSKVWKDSVEKSK